MFSRKELYVSTDDETSIAWWRGRWLRFNRDAFTAGAIAFIVSFLVASLVEVFPQDDPPEFTIFHLFFSGTLYMLGSNILFSLGPFCEFIYMPGDVGRFRQRAHAVVYWLAILSPFTIPLLFLCIGIFLQPSPKSPY